MMVVCALFIVTNNTTHEEKIIIRKIMTISIKVISMHWFQASEVHCQSHFEIPDQ